MVTKLNSKSTDWTSKIECLDLLTADFPQNSATVPHTYPKNGRFVNSFPLEMVPELGPGEEEAEAPEAPPGDWERIQNPRENPHQSHGKSLGMVDSIPLMSMFGGKSRKYLLRYF